MNAFLKKEVNEILKTYRLWAIPVLFLFIGLLSPATAKFLPALLKGPLEAENIIIKLPEPDAVQAFEQYFKNLTQIGLLAVVLFSMGLVTEEKARGILAQIVTKPVSRPAIIWAKWLVQGGWFLSSMIVGASGCYLYTVGLFGRAELGRFVLANILFAVYLILIFSVTLAAGAVARGQGMAAGLGLAGFILFSTLPVFGRTLQRYSPGALPDIAFKLASGAGTAGGALWPAIVSIVVIAAVLVGGIFIFDRQEL